MAEPDKTKVEQEEKGSFFPVLLFITGIIAVAVTALYTALRGLPNVVLGCEILVLACLIGLLVATLASKKRLIAHLIHKERYPYANVNKREIENVFDLIVTEEKKRIRLGELREDSAVAAASAPATPSVSSVSVTSAEEPEAKKEVKTTSAAEDEEVPVITSEADEDEEIFIILDDEKPADEAVESVKVESVNKEEKAPAEHPEKAPAAEKTDANGNRIPATERNTERKRTGAKDGHRPPQKRRPPDPYAAAARRDPYGRAPSRNPYDPHYYDSYYYDYGEPMRRNPYAQPQYYNEYGEPIRRRTQYDQYGNPIPQRRPPQGQRRPPQGGQQRRPAQNSGLQQRRPRPGEPGAVRVPEMAAAAAGASSASGTVSRPMPRGHGTETDAPVEMTPKKKRSNYGDDYVPVAVFDDEIAADDSRYQSPSEQRRAAAERERNSKKAAPKTQQPNAYYDDDSEVDRSMPIVIDDYEPEYEEDRRPAPAPRRQSVQSTRPPQEKYVPDYEDEVVIVPDLPPVEDDEPYVPRRNAAAAAPVNRDEDYDPRSAYSDEEDVVVLPRDDGYDQYIEKKKAEERKAARRAEGKIALTIKSMHRKKIRRKSRRYKQFRVDVRGIGTYLNSYSAKTGRKY